MDTLLERLRAVDTTTLSDAGKQLAVMDPGLRPLRTGLKLVGRAVTVVADDDLMPVLDGLARCGSGDVLVVEGRPIVRWPASCSATRPCAGAWRGS